MGFDWKRAIGSIAPALGLALGGPGAAAAVKVVSGALLGHDKGTESDLEAALAAGASPEQIEKLKSAERDFTLKLVDAAVALEKLENDDRASARAREIAVKDRMPAILALVLTAAEIGMLVLLVMKAVPPENRDPFMLTLGSLSTCWIGAMSYYHGTSSGSRAKDGVLGKMVAK